MIVAMDCDLRRLTAVDETGHVLVSRGSWAAAVLSIPLIAPTLLLYEISGPAYARTDSRAASRATTRWAIYNAARAGALYRYVAAGGGQMLVSPSSTWTKGYDVKTRHKLAGVVGKNKDIRECQCMIWMYRNNPAAWKPLDTYLEELL
jgi:hypothetical protein